MVRQFASTSARLTAPVPSGRPRLLATPRLVVASASKPRDARSRAVPVSQGFGMMNAPGRACNARNVAAFSACVGIAVLLLVPARRLRDGTLPADGGPSRPSREAHMTRIVLALMAGWLLAAAPP